MGDTAEDVETIEIVLSKGSTGLGFHISGGNDNHYLTGDPRIFVTQIKENASAARDGRLNESDRILEIDGICVRNVGHDEAVALLLKTDTSCRLLVEQDVYRKAMAPAMRDAMAMAKRGVMRGKGAVNRRSNPWPGNQATT